MSVAVFIEHRVQPGRRDEVRAVWEKWMRPAILANDAHEAYAYTFDGNDPDVIRAFQQYHERGSGGLLLGDRRVPFVPVGSGTAAARPARGSLGRGAVVEADLIGRRAAAVRPPGDGRPPRRSRRRS